MAIEKIEIIDFLVFKNKFTLEFSPGINVFIGGNGTGKTTLLKLIYSGADWFSMPHYKPDPLEKYFGITNEDIPIGLDYDTKMIMDKLKNRFGAIYLTVNTKTLNYSFPFINDLPKKVILSKPVYMPEKDILEHAKGLLPFIEKKQSGFTSIYRDVLISAQDIPTSNQSETQKNICKKIADIIEGNVYRDEKDGSFYTLKIDGSRVPFNIEASGYKKLGIFGLLVSCGQLDPGAVLFWDEPENSLNPEHMSTLVDILLELSRNDVQIFIATHNEIFASYFAVNRKKGDKVMFASLYKEGTTIMVDTNDRFDLLDPNNLTKEIVKLYEREIEQGLGDNV